jgi:hypothetical protein
VAKKQLDLRIGQLKHSRWQPLFVRPLAKDSKFAQPAIHTRVMPAIPVAGNHQLMPLTASSVAGNFPSKRFGRFGHCPAVVLRCSRVAQRLMHKIAAVADEMAKEDQVLLWPFGGHGRSWNLPRKRETIAGMQVRGTHPPRCAIQTMPIGQSNRTTARKADFLDWTHANRPDAIAAGRDDLALLGHRPHLGRGSNELANRDARSIGEKHSRVACDAFPQIRHHRPLVGSSARAND